MSILKNKRNLRSLKKNILEQENETAEEIS